MFESLCEEKQIVFRMDERIIRKEVINASLDVHPTQTALVIDYDEGVVLKIYFVLSEQYPLPINPHQIICVLFPAIS